LVRDDALSVDQQDQGGWESPEKQKGWCLCRQDNGLCVEIMFDSKIGMATDCHYLFRE